MNRRFRVRSLFGLILLFALVFAGYRAADVRYQREQRALAELYNKRFSVSHERTLPTWAKWLPSRISERFAPVTRLRVFGNELNEDEGFITETKLFTDDSLPLVLELKYLRNLSLDGTNISGDGLKRLCDLRHLRSLDVSSTRTGAEAQERFRDSMPNCRLCVNGNSVRVVFRSKDVIHVDGVHVPTNAIERRLKMSLAAAKAAGHTKVTLNIRTGFYPEDELTSSSYLAFTDLAKAFGTDLGYQYMTADGLEGEDDQYFDLQLGEELVLQQMDDGVMALRPEKELSKD